MGDAAGGDARLELAAGEQERSRLCCFLRDQGESKGGIWASKQTANPSLCSATLGWERTRRSPKTHWALWFLHAAEQPRALLTPHCPSPCFQE